MRMEVVILVMLLMLAWAVVEGKISASTSTCYCKESVAEDAPWGKLEPIMWGEPYPFQYCTHGSKDRDEWRPATYSLPPAGGVVGCCKWESFSSSYCNIMTQMNCPYGATSFRSWGSAYYYDSHCLSWNGLKRTINLTLGIVLAVGLVVVAITTYMRYCSFNGSASTGAVYEPIPDGDSETAGRAAPHESHDSGGLSPWGSEEGYTKR